MEQSISFTLVYYADMIISIIMPLAALILGLIIAFNKVRSTRTLGLYFFFISINSLLSSVHYIMTKTMTESELAGLFLPLNITFCVCSLTATLFLCIFFHKNYGRKLYLPIYLISILGLLADRIVIVIMAKQFDPSKPEFLWINLISAGDSFMISSVITVIVIITFIRFRKSEKVIPQAWLMEVILLIWSSVHFTLLCFVYKSVIENGNFIIATNMGYMGLRIAHNISLIIFPLYVLISALGSSKK